MPKRPIRIEGEIAFVPLTKGYEAIIDAADVPLVSGWNWTALVRPHTVYAYRRITAPKGEQQPVLLMHRMLIDAPPEKQVDHRDHNGLNNRRKNIRDATRSQNQGYLRTPKSNTSGFKGATWDAQRGLWRAQLRHDGKRHYIGHFHTAKEAGDAYAKASLLLRGEFHLA